MRKALPVRGLHQREALIRLGDNLRHHRLRAGRTQQELAGALGLHGPSAIANYEVGRRDPGAVQLACIADLLGVPAVDLLAGVAESAQEGYEPPAWESALGSS